MKTCDLRFGVIASDKAYFYSAPSADKRLAQLLLKGQSVLISSDMHVPSDYYLCDYTSDKGKRTTGWMLRSDIVLDY